MAKDRKRMTHIHGNVEKLTQIETVQGDVIFGGTPDAATLLKRGIQLLKARAYEHAIKAFHSAIESEPSEPNNYYYLALALLKGRRPKVLTRTEAESISRHLQTSCVLNSNRSQYYYLWALVKFDFYVSQGLRVSPPDIVELLEKAESLVCNREAIREMLGLIPHIKENPVYDVINRNV
jgi:tetratricopeptide (TPR) repeat protein